MKEKETLYKIISVQYIIGDITTHFSIESKDGLLDTHSINAAIKHLEEVKKQLKTYDNRK